MCIKSSIIGEVYEDNRHIKIMGIAKKGAQVYEHNINDFTPNLDWLCKDFINVRSHTQSKSLAQFMNRKLAANQVQGHKQT